MNREQIIKLVNAGFTKEEIAGLLTTDATHGTPAMQTQQEPPNTETAGIMEMLTKINESLTAQSQMFQNMNTLNSTQPQVQDFNDILATIINPTGGK